MHIIYITLILICWDWDSSSLCISRAIYIFYPNFCFAYETPKQCVKFLDLNVSLQNSATSADIYVKSTDS